MNNKRKKASQPNLEDRSSNQQQNKKGGTSIKNMSSSQAPVFSPASSTSNLDELAQCQAALRAVQAQQQESARLINTLQTQNKQLQAQQQESARLVDDLTFEMKDLKTELTFYRY